MSPLHRTIHPDPDVVDTEIDADQVALLHLGSKTYFSLNRTGARIWRDLKQGLSLETISMRLQEEFDVDAKQAQESIERLVDELTRHGLAREI